MARMRPRDRWIATLLSITGVGLCVSAVIHFLMTILYNRLPKGTTDHQVRDQYLIVGNFYTQGFVVGFFFCLSLAMLAAVIASWREHVLSLRESLDEMSESGRAATPLSADLPR